MGIKEEIYFQMHKQYFLIEKGYIDQFRVQMYLEKMESVTETRSQKFTDLFCKICSQAKLRGSPSNVWKS